MSLEYLQARSRVSPEAWEDLMGDPAVVMANPPTAKEAAVMVANGRRLFSGPQPDPVYTPIWDALYRGAQACDGTKGLPRSQAVARLQIQLTEALRHLPGAMTLGELLALLDPIGHRKATIP